MTKLHFDCPLHITWVCDDCGHKMRNRNKLHPGHSCSHCRSYKGHAVPVHHTSRRAWDCQQEYLEMYKRGEV